MVLQPPAASTPSARRAALTVALEAVRAAGGCEELEQSVSQALSKTAQAAADSRPLGARLDSCKAKAAKAEARLAQTAAAVEQALARHDEAARELEACQAALAELEREVAAPLVVAQPPAAATGVQELLSALEQCSGGLPEKVLGCMHSLHALLRNAEVPSADASMASEDSLANGAELPPSAASVGNACGAAPPVAPHVGNGATQDGAEPGGTVRVDARRDRASPY